jgi:large subunit ribosomal protein L31
LQKPINFCFKIKDCTKKPDFFIKFATYYNYTAKSVCKTKNMKKGIHPEAYKTVIFKDMSNGTSFLSRSTAYSKETLKWEDGNEYPVIKLEISNTSHPFYTGKNVLVDTAGRIDKFKKRYEKKAK